MVHITISPPSPWDLASRATTGLAKLVKKKRNNKKSGMEGKQKKYLHLTSFLCSSLALHSPTVWASFACMYVCHVCTSAGMHKSERVEKKDTDYFNFFLKIL